MTQEDQCDACGERNPPGSAFCVLCGTYLGWEQPGHGPAEGGAAAAASPPPPATDPPPGAAATPAPAPAAATPPVTPAPPAMPTRQEPAAPTAPAPTSGTVCPHCGRDNAASLRFCGRCGHPLVAPEAATPMTASPAAGPRPRRRWWDPENREARRDYRKSLPALYRWRRVLIALAALVAAGVVLGATGNNPVGWVQDRWRDLTVDLTAVDGVAAAAEPEGSVAPTYRVQDLPGPRDVGWATRWPVDSTAATDCGDTPAAGSFRLTWTPEVRVRGLDVWAGLGSANTERQQQFRPRRIDIRYAEECVSLALADVPGRQRLELDTKVAVDTLLISVGDAFPSEAAPLQELVAVGGIEVLHRPE